MDWGVVVDAYWRHHCDSTSQVRADRLRADETRWAWEAVEQHVADADDDVVGLLCALADAAADDSALAYLGAGPIEELLGAHASRFGMSSKLQRDATTGSARRSVAPCSRTRSLLNLLPDFDTINALSDDRLD